MALVAPDAGAVPELVGVGAELVVEGSSTRSTPRSGPCWPTRTAGADLGRAGRARAMAWSTRAEALDAGPRRSTPSSCGDASAARDAPRDLR